MSETHASVQMQAGSTHAIMDNSWTEVKKEDSPRNQKLG